MRAFPVKKPVRGKQAITKRYWPAWMGTEQYNRAPESRKVIRNTIRALFDPVHGDDAFSNAPAIKTHSSPSNAESHAPPRVADETLARHYFTGFGEREPDMVRNIMGGATARVETIATDGRLAPLFDHVGDRRQPVDGETRVGRADC